MKKTGLALFAVAALGASAYAVDIPLNNGSFDTGNPGSNTFGLITSWTAQATPAGAQFVGVFTSYAGITPQNGPRMALLSNMGTSTVSLRQVVPVELFLMPYLHFNYIYLTEDAATTAIADLDTFSVVIDYFSDAAGLNQVGTETYYVSNIQLSDTGINPGGPFSSTVSASSRNDGMTMGEFIVPISIITAPYANFTFYLENDGASSAVSGVLIDNVYINPEPGTIALFGLGAAGLGAMAWRRRKAKKAAAPAA